MKTASRLVRIKHERCMEYDCSTTVLAPEDWDVERIRREVRDAQDAYLDAVTKVREALKTGGPPNPGYHVRYDDHPDLTVAEVKAEHERRRAEYEAWETDQRRHSRRFEGFLRDRGFVPLWDDDAPVTSVSCDWGHRHGWNLAYGDARNAEDSMPSPPVLAKALAAALEDEEDWE